MSACFKTDVFSLLNQLGKVNELLIKPEPLVSTEEKEEEEDVVEESVEEESGSKADCVTTATSLETALNLVNLNEVTRTKAFLLHSSSDPRGWIEF